MSFRGAIKLERVDRETLLADLAAVEALLKEKLRAAV